MKPKTGILIAAMLYTLVCLRSHCVAGEVVSMNIVGYQMVGDATSAVARIKTPGAISSHELQKETAILKAFGMYFEVSQEGNGESAMPPWYQWQGGLGKGGLIAGAYTALTIDGRAVALAKEGIYTPPTNHCEGLSDPVFDRGDNKDILYELKDGCIITKDYGAIPVAVRSSEIVTNSNLDFLLIFTDAQLAALRRQTAETNGAPQK